MENMKCSLADRMHARGRLGERFIRCAMTNVIKALRHLKRIGIVHRDLTPANILLDERDNAKLCDFGIAGILHGSAPLTVSTCGCTAYLAVWSLIPIYESTLSCNELLARAMCHQ